MLEILKTRRFWPLFATQFLGAVNDNLFKQAITLLVLYRLALSDAAGGLFVVAGTALFILPYILFSILAGQLADKYDKSRITQILKVTEIGAALVGLLEQLGRDHAQARLRAKLFPLRRGLRTPPPSPSA